MKKLSHKITPETKPLEFWKIILREFDKLAKKYPENKPIIKKNIKVVKWNL